MKKIAIILMLLFSFESPTGIAAIRDQRHVLGMVLVKGEDKQLLEMVICEVGAGEDVDSAKLADTAVCRNAFVDSEDNSYYFAELTNKDLRHQATVSGYLKLATVVAIPVLLGIVVGRQAKRIIPNLRILVGENGKLMIDKGAKNDDARRAAKESLDRVLEDKKLTRQIGFWGGVIAAIVTQHRGDPIIWGKEDRKLVSNWDKIFEIHLRGFEQPKELYDQQAIKQILTTIARRLTIKINHEVKFDEQ